MTHIEECDTKLHDTQKVRVFTYRMVVEYIPHEFELLWIHMVAKFGLQNNEWIMKSFRTQG